MISRCCLAVDGYEMYNARAELVFSLSEHSFCHVFVAVAVVVRLNLISKCYSP